MESNEITVEIVHDIIEKCDTPVKPFRNVPAKVFTTIRCIDKDGQYPLKVIHLHDDLYLEDKQKLLIKRDVDLNTICIGVYNKTTKQTYPLTEENKNYCKHFHLNVM